MNFQNLASIAAIIPMLAPAADRWNTDPVTDIVRMDGDRLAIIFMEGAGGTGTVKFEPKAYTDFLGSNGENIPFRYKKTAAAGGDVFSAKLADGDKTNGYTTTAGANKLIYIEIDKRDLPAGKLFVGVKCTEVANDPCLGAAVGLMYHMGFTDDPMPTVIA